MPAKYIVIGQRVDAAKVKRAKELRHAMTPAERLLWQHLRANRLDGFHFRRQQVIDGFIVDFYCHAAGLIVEVDGVVHQEQIEYDEQRDQILTARGLRILRFRNEACVQDVEGVLASILAACCEGTNNLTP
jgi:very-short-patch-repair endonuclease